MNEAEARKAFATVGPNSMVRYHPIIGGPNDGKTYTVTDIGHAGGRTVVWLKGNAGCVALEAISKATS